MTDRQTHGRTDGRTDRRTGKNNMSPDPEGGRHKKMIEKTSDFIMALQSVWGLGDLKKK